ncbi:MAG: hypothetical protein DRQ55_09830 [Planctomycetota bacterium]|nr:MAG: hypothetical protein DRQ55_09830 [Planctomycetota bacterium]
MLLALAGCSRGDDAPGDDTSASTLKLPMPASLEAEARTGFDEGEPPYVHLPIFSVQDGTVHLQGTAMLSRHYLTTDAVPRRVRLVMVSYSAVVMNAQGIAAPYNLNTMFGTDEVESDSRKVFTSICIVDLARLPPDVTAGLPSAVMASPRKRYVVRIRPVEDLSWGDVRDDSQLELDVSVDDR